MELLPLLCEGRIQRNAGLRQIWLLHGLLLPLKVRVLLLVLLSHSGLIRQKVIVRHVTSQI